MKIALARHRRVPSREALQGCIPAALTLALVVSAPAHAGLLDTSFNPPSSTSVLITAMARQTDGRIVIAEAFAASDSTPRSNRIARLNPDGSLDPSFNPGTGPNGDINAVAIQPDGRILIG